METYIKCNIWPLNGDLGHNITLETGRDTKKELKVQKITLGYVNWIYPLLDLSAVDF